jgi:CBS domain containing-hemolysin-like protein
VIESGEDRIVGLLDVKDVVTAEQTAGVTAGDLSRELLVVPETTSIDDLLLQFQSDHQQVAAVIDEWGAFEGLVTVEDVLEAIVGELRDDFDVTERTPSIHAREDGTYDVDGAVGLDEINETLSVTFESGSYETIGGVVLDELGHAPDVGDTVDLQGYQFEVTAVDGNRIDTLRVGPEGEPGAPASP